VDPDIEKWFQRTRSHTPWPKRSRGLCGSASHHPQNLSLDAQHRHRIGIDLQNMSTPTGKNLVKDMVKDMWPKSKGDRAGLLIPFCHVNGKANLAFVFRPEDRQMNSCR
jgi:hypothetical protein